MPYQSRTYQVLIASPGDVEKEREIAVGVLQDWNAMHSATRKVTLLPLRWETHAAPAYNVRPQEVINRAIVDNCDLLVGVFWARLGTDTGVADSGTIEEIERVAKRGKPVMLYFSHIGVDPYTFEMDQVARVRAFAEEIRPHALVKSYESHLEFRDILARDLELKVAELETKERSGAPPPIEFTFPKGESTLEVVVGVPTITDLDEVQDSELRSKIEANIPSVEELPVSLMIRNTGTSGIRDLYVAMFITADNPDDLAYVKTYPAMPEPYLTSFSSSASLVLGSSGRELQRGSDYWYLNLEWGALQPQRIRWIDQLYIHVNKSTSIQFMAKIYADNFPDPLMVKADLNVKCLPKPITAKEIEEHMATTTGGLSYLLKNFPPLGAVK